MDIVVKGRHTVVLDRFRAHAVDKLSKIERFNAKVIRVDVEVSQERNPRQSDNRDRVQLTCLSRGPAIRAEATADDPYAAFELAFGKLEARLRRSADRRRVHHGNRTPVSVAAATSTAEQVSPNGSHPDATSSAQQVPPGAVAVVSVDEAGGLDGHYDVPVIVREKVHQADPMTIDEALFEMELVGHDFYLFVDAESQRPSVVYRRHGYDYGVIRLERIS